MNMLLPMPPFVPPKNAPDFIKKVEDKCHALISLSIWDLDRTRLDSWLDQFTTDEESYFAACVLDALAYRPKEQFSSSLKALLRGSVRWHLQAGLPDFSDCDLERALSDGSFTTAVIAPAIDEDSPPTKSAPFVLRRMKKVLGTSSQSPQENIKPLRSLTEPLQVAKDNGAKRALIPIENKRNFLDVSADIMEHVDPIFFGDPKTAAMKVLGS